MVLFTSGSSLTWGNLQVLFMASPPGIYLLSTLNNWLFTLLQRFQDDRICIFWWQGRQMGWQYEGSLGNLSICPCLDHLELPYHTLGELLSISCLKVWGDTQEPCNNMANLLVHTEDDSEAESYSMALVWISPHQAQASTMEEALGTLYACISSGPNWPYVLAQLYKGSNHTPLPKDKYLGILPQAKVEESPYG